MNPEDRQRLFDALDRVMREDEQARERLNVLLLDFSSRLFSALEKALAEISARGTPASASAAG